MRLLSAEEVDDKKAALWGVVEKKQKWENVTTVGEIEGGLAKKISSKYIVAKGQRDDDAFINSDDEKYSNY